MFANFSFSDLRERFQQLSLREQLLVVAVVGAALYFLVDSLVFASQKQRHQETETAQKMLQSQIVVLSAEMSAIVRTRADELEQKEREYSLLKQQVAQLDAVAGHVSSELPKISQLVSDVLGAAPAKVKVVGIRTVPVKPLSGAGKPGAAGSVQALYKHGFELEVRGSYLDLLSYLRQLEEAHPQLFWSNVLLTAGTFPENTLRASVFMLSTQAKL